MSPPAYIGRFAPSPTGPLHFGSLLAALASYLDARAHHGQWLLRIDDLDKPREVAGASDAILRVLDAYGLHWDGPVTYQHQQQQHYDHALQQLLDQGHVYYCTCSRQDFPANPQQHACRQRRQPPAGAWSLRIKAPDETLLLDDAIQGRHSTNLATCHDDFVVYRKDGITAYQLATAVDESLAGITHVVRGSDLLDSTFRQQLLMRWLYGHSPLYAHIPVATHADGQKLSKQSFATALEPADWKLCLLAALRFLGQPQPADAGTPRTLLDEACQHWSLARIPRRPALPANDFCKP
ncbi:MAG: tRNA glutamyl-Q(34) synthetase GluQRS [Gammaproteobacteria bacterium]|nr:MAG: tRNA glutamyl-Q(34) synthetase GluQRS [Gammaproteobacteria bacterium]